MAEEQEPEEFTVEKIEQSTLDKLVDVLKRKYGITAISVEEVTPPNPEFKVGYKVTTDRPFGIVHLVLRDKTKTNFPQAYHIKNIESDVDNDTKLIEFGEGQYENHAIEYLAEFIAFRSAYEGA